jgi:hypothetical protein
VIVGDVINFYAEDETRGPLTYDQPATNDRRSRSLLLFLPPNFPGPIIVARAPVFVQAKFDGGNLIP